MTRPVPKIVAGFAIVVALLLIAAFILDSLRPLPAPAPLPNPNGYDDLVAAGKMLTDGLSEYREKNEQELKALLVKNSDALDFAKRGLSREIRVPLAYYQTNGPAKTNMDYILDVGKLKGLAFLFAAEGALAESENRPSDAAKYYIDGIRVGTQGTRGGLIIHALVGIAIEAICAAPLQKLLPSLNSNECRTAAAALESADAMRQSMETVLEQENVWSARTYGWKGSISRVVMYKTYQQTEKRFISRFTSRQIATRMLICDLAARAYELEKGERPKQASDLVPAYLKAVPQDPTTHTNMVYP